MLCAQSLLCDANKTSMDALWWMSVLMCQEEREVGAADGGGEACPVGNYITDRTTLILQ